MLPLSQFSAVENIYLNIEEQSKHNAEEHCSVETSNALHQTAHHFQQYQNYQIEEEKPTDRSQKMLALTFKFCDSGAGLVENS